MKLKVSASIGSVTGEVNAPKKMKAMMTLAHGAGAGMNHPFMTQMSEELAKLGIGTLRFNFPFTENKKGRPDVPAVAHATIQAALEHVIKKYSDVPIYASGKSFGGRMSSQYLSKQDEVSSKVSGLVFFGFPLHAIGKPSMDRADHLQTVPCPMLFLQGTRDDLAQWDLIEQVTSKLPKATLKRIEGADHSFKVSGKKDVLTNLATIVSEWMR